MAFDKVNTIRVIKYKYDSVKRFCEEIGISRTILYRYLNSSKISVEDKIVQKIIVALSKEVRVKLFKEN